MRPLFTPDERLMLCASFVRKGAKLADIGTDHAYLPVWLARTGVISCAIAADIKAEPLQNGNQTIEKYRAGDKVVTRLCDGLNAIDENEADDIVIAGMGGETIIHILSEAPWLKNSSKHLILQPMSKHELVISYLYNNGFEIKEHKACISEGKVYTAMLAVYTGKVWGCDEVFSYTGLLNPKNDCDKLFVKMVLNYLDNKAKGDSHYNDVSNIIRERFFYDDHK